MKQSKFNQFMEHEGNVIAFNAMSCALAVLTNENYKALCSCANNYGQLNQEFIDQLVHGGYLIEDDCDELVIIKNRLLQSRYSTSTLSLTIAPTLGCNFNCIYCFEQDHMDFTKMNLETQDSLVKFIEAKIADGTNFVSVSWYGGEPLLALDVIESLSHRFRALCDKNNVKYSAGIVTNGYLLSRDVAKILNECNVSNAQITLDGPPDIHDSRRFLHGGKATFQNIFDNIKDAVDIVPQISVRVNVDNDNIERISEVKELFACEKLVGKVHVYIAMVDALNGLYERNACLTTERFATLDLNFYDNPLVLYPMPRANLCGADALNSLVIAPNGSLYKCWNDIGMQDKSFGNINQPSECFSRLYYDYLMYDPTSDKMCVKCNILPICMGGCPHRRIEKSPLRCSLFKVYIDKYMRKSADYISAQKHV